MKRKIMRIIAVVLAVVLIFAGSFGGYVLYRFNRNTLKCDINYEEVYSRNSISLKAEDDGLFRVLKINDTHLFNGTSENDERTLAAVKSILDETPCDLIIADGDIVDGFNLSSSYDKKNAIESFAQLIESYNVPWTFVPGNNDGEIDSDNDDIIAFLMQYRNFLCGNEKGIDGSMQFFIDITYNSKTVHSIAVLDSGMRKPKAIGSYDYIKENQIKWLLDGVNERQVKTSVFFHMPTPAFKTAYDNGTAYDGIDRFETYAYDDIEKNELFDNMTADNEYISLLSCGHVHSNNMCSYYNGRYYQLSAVSGYNASHDDFIIPSCTLTVIDTLSNDVQNMYQFEQLAK